MQWSQLERWACAQCGSVSVISEEIHLQMARNYSAWHGTKHFLSSSVLFLLELG